MDAGSTTEVEPGLPFKLPQDIDAVTSLAPGTRSIARIHYIPGELDDSWALDLSQKSNLGRHASHLEESMW
jgi:hypothetical protein